MNLVSENLLCYIFHGASPVFWLKLLLRESVAVLSLSLHWCILFCVKIRSLIFRLCIVLSVIPLLLRALRLLLCSICSPFSVSWSTFVKIIGVWHL
jgi:hypothetical protein